jgi:hypothetical protein
MVGSLGAKLIHELPATTTSMDDYTSSAAHNLKELSIPDNLNNPADIQDLV